MDHFEIVVRARNLLALGRRMATAGSGPEPVRAAPPAEPAGRESVPAADPRTILDAMPALISAADRDGRCIYVNAACAACAGAEPAALLGLGAAALHGPERGERSRGRDLEVFAAGRPAAPYWEDAPGKAGRRLLTSKVPLRNGGNEVVAVLTTSIEMPGETLAEALPAAAAPGAA